MANINASGIIKAKVNDDIYTIHPITRISDVDGLSSALSGKVDKENGKGLSTEDYTTAEKNKLSGIEANANDYVHPTTSGSKHIPSGGSSGKILGWSADGTAAWVDPSSGGGGDVSSVKVGSTTYNPDSSGIVSLPAYPTTLPASDVYSWAKSSSKPSYSASEVGAVPTSRKINGYDLTANRTLTYSDVGAASSGHSHSTATTSSSGFMSYSDKAKLNKIDIANLHSVVINNMSGGSDITKRVSASGANVTVYCLTSDSNAYAGVSLTELIIMGGTCYAGKSGERYGLYCSDGANYGTVKVQSWNSALLLWNGDVSLSIS